MTLLGSPAQPKEAEAKMFMASRKLPEMRQTVKLLRKQVAALTARLDALENAGTAANEEHDLGTDAIRLAA